MSFTIRTAGPDDAEILTRLILELADYERLRDEAETTQDTLRQQLAPDASPRLDALLATTGDGEPAGFAIFFPIYSTFKANWGLYLEDLYVRPEHRGSGLGLALMRRVAGEAVTRGCVRMEWQVLNWNRLAIDFYERLGASSMDDWTTMRLTGDPLRSLADGA
jgi:GNAT superfamily N-acetyltransferase